MQGTNVKPRIAHRVAKIHTELYMKNTDLRHYEVLDRTKAPNKRVRDGSHVAIDMNYGGASFLSLSTNPNTDITPQELKGSNYIPLWTISTLFFHVRITPRPEQMQGTHLKQRIAHRMGKIHTALHVKRSLLRHHVSTR